MSKLKLAESGRYEIFAREYVIDLNGARAAIAAGYSEATARQQATRLLTKVYVRRLIEKLQTIRASKIELKAETVLEEMRRLAFWNLDDYIRRNEDGTADIDLSATTRDQMAAVTEITVDTTGGTGDGERRQVLRTKIKLADKTKNLEMLARHLAMFNDKIQITGFEGLAERLNEVRGKRNANA